MLDPFQVFWHAIFPTFTHTDSHGGNINILFNSQESYQKSCQIGRQELGTSPRGETCHTLSSETVSGHPSIIPDVPVSPQSLSSFSISSSNSFVILSLSLKNPLDLPTKEVLDICPSVVFVTAHSSCGIFMLSSSELFVAPRESSMRPGL